MDAMILAAGRGERLRPLTDTTPKPLIDAGGRPLIAYHLDHLAAAGVTRVVINVAHLGERIVAALGDGHSYGLDIQYSREPPGALETGGGIVHALPQLRGDAFWVINGDVWTDFPLAALPPTPYADAHLVLVPNPPHNKDGDFSLAGRRVTEPVRPGQPTYTFAGIGVYRRALFEQPIEGRFALAPLLFAAAARGRVNGTLYRGAWFDVGTRQRLQALRAYLAAD